MKRKRVSLWERYTRHLDRAIKVTGYAGMRWNWPAWDAYRAGYRDGKRAAARATDSREGT